jgi:uncharacterized phage protein (TIGR02218 family)
MSKTIPGGIGTLIASEYMTMSTGVLIELREHQPKITAITQANPAAVTTEGDHPYSTGDVVTFRDIEGMVEIEGETGVVTVTGVKSFTVDIDTSSGYTAFAATEGSSRANRTFGFTDYDQEFTLNKVLYEAAFAYTPTSVDNTGNLAVDNLEVRGIIDSESISDSDLLAGVYDYAKLEIFLYNHRDITDGQVILKRGQLGEVSQERDFFSAEFRGLAAHLTADNMRTYMPACDAVLGDDRCNYDLVSAEVSGTVTAVTNRRKFEDTSFGDADGEYDNGVLRWTTGDNANREMEVRAYLLTDPTNPSFTLMERMAADIQVGDEFVVTPGCDKSLTVCLNKFNNVINFRGFPHLPGQAELFDYGNRTTD